MKTSADKAGPEQALVRMVRKDQAGLLLDTNLLLLYLALSVSPEFARSFKRTAAYDARLHPLLLLAIRSTSRLVTTPHVLTEASNHCTGGRQDDPQMEQLRSALKTFALRVTERRHQARMLVKDPAFFELGLTDVALMAGMVRRPLLLTTDAPLHVRMESRGLPSVNLTNLAFPAGRYR